MNLYRVNALCEICQYFLNYNRFATIWRNNVYQYVERLLPEGCCTVQCYKTLICLSFCYRVTYSKKTRYQLCEMTLLFSNIITFKCKLNIR